MMNASSQIVNSEGERLDVAFHGAGHLGAIVIIGHGVTANKDRPLLVALADGLAARGWPCLRFSFSGNGESEGKFEDSTVSKEIDDLKSIMKTVPQEKRIAYVGHSMGAAVGVKTAASGMSIQALVSLAGMVDTAGFAEREFGDVKPGEGHMWDEPECPLSEKFIEDMKAIGTVIPEAGRVRAPWLLIHGTEDDVVPVTDSRSAHAAARCEKKLMEIEGAGHMFREEDHNRLVDAIDGWLREHFGG